MSETAETVNNLKKQLSNTQSLCDCMKTCSICDNVLCHCCGAVCDSRQENFCKHHVLTRENMYERIVETICPKCLATNGWKKSN